jgi:hypothetical protein
MYTINYSQGDWSGHVTEEDPDDALSAAKELARALATLSEAYPKPVRARSVPATRGKQSGLNGAGLACLAYCEANPRCTHDDYTAAGHTLRTVKWLRTHGYLQSVDGAWTVNRDGGLTNDESAH